MATNGGLRPWVTWAAVLIVLLGVAGFAWWLVTFGLEPVTHPTPSSGDMAPTPSGLEAANGEWCPTGEDSELGCVTVALPAVSFSDAPDDVAYVFPPDGDADAEPSTLDFSFAPNLGDCWQAVVGARADEADAAFVYCPQGAASGDADLDASDSSVVRLWITQDLATAPMMRNAGG